MYGLRLCEGVFHILPSKESNFPDIQQNMRRCLKEWLQEEFPQYRFEEASSPKEAFNYCRMMPELVIMDGNLPELDGIDATMYIKAVYPAVQVLIFAIHENGFYREPAEEGRDKRLCGQEFFARGHYPGNQQLVRKDRGELMKAILALLPWSIHRPGDCQPTPQLVSRSNRYPHGAPCPPHSPMRKVRQIIKTADGQRGYDY